MLFDYECEKCHLIVEVESNKNGEIKSYDDRKCLVSEDSMVITCRKCNTEMKKKFPLPNFILKGNGWAKDGYGNGKKDGKALKKKVKN